MLHKDFLSLHLRDLPYFRALIRSVESVFYQSLSLRAPVLDVGCGDGHFASLTFERRIEVGIDPWCTPLYEASRYAAYRWLVAAEGGRIPFQDGYFASAISNSVLEHILHVDVTLNDVARVLLPGAPFYFCVPNERYLSELSIAETAGCRYREWFRRITHVFHAEGPDIWEARLAETGFNLEKWWHYFSPAAMRVLEWGHYFGLPSLLARKLTGKWILVPARWNLWFTEKVISRYASSEPIEDGVFTFYVARKKV